MRGRAAGGRPRVVQLHRRPFPLHYSLERVFAQLRGPLAARLNLEEVEACAVSKGLLPRLRIVWQAARLRADVVHVTGDITFAAILRRRASTVITVHDTEFLERATPAKRLLYTWLWLRLPVRRAAVVTVPTEATASDLIRALGRRPATLRTVPEPVADEFRPVDPPGHPTPVVLMIGTRVNKNVPRMAAALAGVPCRVVIVGELDGTQRDALAAAGVVYESRVGLSDDEVRACYEQCDLLLFATSKEGFGLPVLEAQAVGRPVVTSDRPPMPAVAGGGAILVDPDDVASIRAGVLAVLDDPDRRKAIVERGRANVERYRSAAVADAYAAIYEELASRR